MTIDCRILWADTNEWFYNESSQKLYYFFNGTSPPTGAEKFVATKTKVLFNISATQAAPVRDITLRGLEIRDTAYTYLGTDVADRHGMPSGQRGVERGETAVGPSCLCTAG